MSLSIVTEFVEGKTPADGVAMERPLRKVFSQLVATIAETLHYAHIRGLVHRDVKPANILLDKEDKPYLADFGLALKDEDYGRGRGLAGIVAGKESGGPRRETPG